MLRMFNQLNNIQIILILYYFKKLHLSLFREMINIIIELCFNAKLIMNLYSMQIAIIMLFKILKILGLMVFY